MTSRNSEDVMKVGSETDHEPLLESSRRTARSTFEADEDPSCDDGSNGIGGHVSSAAIMQSSVHPLGPGLDPEPQQTLFASNHAGYGSVNGSQGSNQDPGNDLGSSPGQLKSANGVPSKYLGVSAGRFWLIFGGILAGYFVSALTLEKSPENRQR